MLVGSRDLPSSLTVFGLLMSFSNLSRCNTPSTPTPTRAWLFTGDLNSDEIQALLRQAHLFQQFGVARVGVPRVQRAKDFNEFQISGLFCQRFVQPRKGLLFIAQFSIPKGDVCGIHVSSLCQLLLHLDFPSY